MKTHFTAKELADMALPGFPASKEGVLKKATTEQWPYRDGKGLGGKRREFQVPDYVLALIDKQPKAPAEPKQGKATSAKAEVVQHPRMSDVDLMQGLMVAVDAWLDKRGLAMQSDKKATLVALLYRYFEREPALDIEKLDSMLSKIA